MNELKCRFCQSSNISLIIDFGNVALAGAFLQPGQFPDEIKYPQQLYFCKDCFLLQIINKVDPSVLFKDYFYFSSAIKTLRDHFAVFAQEVTKRFLTPGQSAVLEIGCNDGVMLRAFAKLDLKTVIGIDPSTNVISTIKEPNIITINDFFTEKAANEIKNKYGAMNMIVANNVFAHIDDIQDVTRGIDLLLAKDGVFIFEVHYIGSLINELQYDMIYHEHLYYYSLLALEKYFSGFGMEIFDIKPIPIHAGSMRYYVRKKGELKQVPLSNDVIELKRQEIGAGYDREAAYLNYAHRVEKTKIALIKLLDQIRDVENKSVVGYGASGRANTLIQYCQINNTQLKYIIDDAPAKQGFYTPGSHFPIKAREVLETESPDYVLVFAWSFINEIINKNMKYLMGGGKMIIPLPAVKVVSYEDGKIKEELYS
jgi:methylation protein EvaC